MAFLIAEHPRHILGILGVPHRVSNRSEEHDKQHDRKGIPDRIESILLVPNYRRQSYYYPLGREVPRAGRQIVLLDQLAPFSLELFIRREVVSVSVYQFDHSDILYFFVVLFSFRFLYPFEPSLRNFIVFVALHDEFGILNVFSGVEDPGKKLLDLLRSVIQNVDKETYKENVFHHVNWCFRPISLHLHCQIKGAEL
jgi:hypothetical protein